jgi:alpha-tubulin suppressor-like RCC1 family protein
MATLAILASVSVLSTCDLNKIVNVDTTKAIVLDSTDLTLTLTGSTVSFAGGLAFSLGGTATVGVNSSLDLSQVTKEFTSGDPTVISVVKTTGVMTAVKIGSAKITVRVLAPELGDGVTRSTNVRVRFAGIRVITPLVTDSIQGLGQTRSVSIQGTNNASVLVTGALTADSLKLRTAGVADTTILRLTSTALTAKKNGTSYLVAYFDGLIDSVAVRVRQVAKTITFPTTDFTARHVNFNLSVPLTVKDVADSVITAPTLTWRTKDTTKATVGAATGVLRVKSVTTDSVWAKMDTVERGQKIVVSQIVASLTKFAGDARSDTVAKPVTVLPTVTVLDSGSTPVTGATVIFRPGTGTVTDTLQLSDVNGRARPTAWRLGNVAGTANTLTATSGAATTTFTVTAIAGAPRKLGFTVQPSSAAVGAAIGPAIKVSVQDSVGNVVTTATNSITLTLSNNPGSGALGGTLTVAAVAGVATFSNVTVSASGSGYALLASSGTLIEVISNGFDAFSVAAKLAFVTQPSNVTTSAIMTPAVRVAVQDASGATVTTATNIVTLSISTNPGGAILGGTVSAAAVAGIATFSNLTLNQSGTGYILAAAASGLTTGNSGTFNVVTVGPATKLAFTVQPSNVVAGASIAPAIQVAVQDASGVTVTSSTATITLAIAADSNPGGSTINGGSSVTAVASGGVATFSTVSLNRTGVGYRLVASANSVSSATSNTFTVAAGTAGGLNFLQQPTHTVFGQIMAPPVTSGIQDANGNTVTTAAATSIALTLTNCSATLSGTTTANTTNGVATFSNLSIATQVSNCTLTAAATGLMSATSTAFNIVAATGAAVKLGFITNPPTNTTAGSTLGTIQVALQDASGATVTSGSSVTVTLAFGVNAGSGTLSGTLTANTSNGIATFTGNSIAAAATGYALAATASGYQSAASAAFNITAGTATKWGFLQQPTTTTAGLAFSPAIRAAIQDAFGNTVVASPPTGVSLQFDGVAGTTGGTFDVPLPVTVVTVNGVADWPGLRVMKANAGYKLLVSSQSLTQATSNSFDVVKAPRTTLAFSTQPNASYTAGSVISVTVQTQDSVGNLYTDPAPAVALGLTGGTTGAALSGTKTVTPVSGSAAFTNLSVEKAGTGYQLNASATGFATTASSAFAVTPGALAAVVVSPSDAAISSGTMPFTAFATDALGNTISGSTFTWASLNPSIATINSSTGVATAVRSGQVTISATSGGKVGYALLTVAIPGAAAMASWTSMSGGTSLLIRDVWCAAPTDCFAAGDGGLVLRYNGTSWSTMSSGTTSDLKGIWGFSGSDVYLVGNGGVIRRFNGSTWSAMSSGTTQILLHVWGSSPTNLFATGQGGAILRFSGSAWTAMTSGTTQDLWALWGASDSTVFAGGGSGVILRWNGATWNTMSSGTTQTIFGFWGASATDVFAAGAGGLISRYNGTAWATMTSGTTQILNDIWGTAGDNVFAVGASGTIQRFNGSTWAAQTSGTSQDLSGVWGSPGNTVFTVGLAGTILGGSTSPAAVTFAIIAAGGNHTCAATVGGIAYCWGRNLAGQLGNGSTNDAIVPSSVSGGILFTFLTAGQNHTCGLTAAGVAYCWGSNNNGELGDSSQTERHTPVPVRGGLTFTTLQATSDGGLASTCGLTSSGAYCWGSNSSGQLGIGSFAGPRTTPVAVVAGQSGGSTFIQLAGGAKHVCALANGLYCWGYDAYGQFGDASTSTKNSPTVAGSGLTYASVAAGSFHTCARTSSGVARCWGANDAGQVGNNSTTTPVTTPVLVAAGASPGTFASLTAGVDHTCGLSSAGNAYCWGANYAGQLGDNSSTQRLTPVLVSGGLTFSKLTAGQGEQGGHTCGLTTGGVAYCWGYNGYGQLGIGSADISPHRAPILVLPPQ